METTLRMTPKQERGWTQPATWRKRVWRRHVRRRATAKAQRLGAQVVAITDSRGVLRWTLEVKA
jgi:hypothetical protein